jgi:hypothetical protein
MLRPPRQPGRSAPRALTIDPKSIPASIALAPNNGIVSGYFRWPGPQLPTPLGVSFVTGHGDGHNYEWREDTSLELREDGSIELRE